MTEEITEVKSPYEKEIEKFLKSGGKVKYHHPDKKKIAKMTASFKKSFKITKNKEDELDKKDAEERAKNQDEAIVMNNYVNAISMDRSKNIWAEAAKRGEDPEPVKGKKTFTDKPQEKVQINPKEKVK